MAAFPKYVSDLGHGLVVPECPASIIDGTMFSFLVDADGAKLQTLVDTFLNAPSGGAVEYHVMGSSVMIVFLRAPKHMTTVQPIGYIEDREFTVWIPLFARTRGQPDADLRVSNQSQRARHQRGVQERREGHHLARVDRVGRRENFHRQADREQRAGAAGLQRAGVRQAVAERYCFS